MPSSDTDHGHGESIFSDKGREIFGVGKRWWRSESDGRIVFCKRECSVPCRGACHGKAAEGGYK